MTVTACLLAHDHERLIARAVASARRAADEVLVLDTGSRDKTTEQAAAAGATLVAHAWKNDFAAALNDVLGRAAGDWILILNPDELLEDGAAAAIRAGANEASIFAFRLRVRHALSANRPDHLAQTWEPRLFRRDAELRYRGRLHATFATPLDELAARRGQTVLDMDATIRREAFQSAVTPDKLRWKVRLLEAELPEAADPFAVRVELGLTLLQLGDARGERLLGEASAELAARAGEPVPPPGAGPLVEHALLSSRAGTFDGPTLEKWFGRTPPVVWARVRERVAARDWLGAKPLLERLLEMGSTGDYDSAGGFDPDIVGAAAALNLGVVLRHLGDAAQANALFGRVVGHPTYGEQAARFLGHDPGN